MRAILIPAIALVLASPAGFAAQIYKWVDSQGVTHFDAQPPTGQNATAVDAARPVAPPPPAAPRARDPAQAQAAQRAADQQVQQQVQDQNDQMAQFCDTSRNNLAQLQGNPRIRQEIGGELKPLTEEERQGKIALVQKQLAENCQ
ncbi:DUF4124 domain-containing protein [Pseudomonas sp. TE3610]